MNDVNKIKNKYTLMYVMAALIGVALFLYLYGVEVLNPINTKWLLRGSDLSQHYIGWEAYRKSKWMFPFGCYDILSYPAKMSVIFSDSIPLVAFIFKLLSPVLPEQFQYFGWWGLLCFVLQAVVGVHITSRFTKNPVISFCGGMLFLLSPVMIYRMYYHTALAGQWILLIAIDLMVTSIFEDAVKNSVEKGAKTIDSNREVIAWGAVGLLAAGTHIYLLLMCGIVLLGRCLYSLLKCRSIKNIWKSFAAFLASAVAVVFLMGGFVPGTGAGLGGLGSYSMNLNSLINSCGWSSVFKELTLVSEKQIEGLGYPGLGVYFLLLMSAVSLPLILKENKGCNAEKQLPKIFSASVVILGTILFALSPTISFGDKILIQIPLPEIVEKLWTVFRATGRLVWIIVYMLIALSIISVSYISKEKRYEKWTQYAFVLFVILQIFDLHVKFTEINYNYRNLEYKESFMIDDDFWNQVGENNTIKHINLADSLSSTDVYVLSQWCLDNDKTINRYHFARKNKDIVNENLKASLANPDEENLYLFFDKQILTCKEYDLNYYRGDRFIVGYKGTLNLPPADVQINEISMELNNDEGLIEGEFDESGRVLHKEGISHGPGWTIPKGNYEILISGSNLDNTEIYLRSADDKVHEYEYEKESAEEIFIETSIDEEIEDFEIYVYNPSETDVRINGIILVEK